MARSFASGFTDSLYNTSTAVVSTYPFTMACWFYVSDGGTRGLISVGDGTLTNAYWLLTSGNQLLVQARSGGSSTNTATVGSLTNGTWYWGAGIFTSATDRKVYLSGSATTATDTTSITASGINKTGVGCLVGFGGYEFYGGIAEPAIWNVALTTAEIDSLAAGVSPTMIRPASLQAYWPLFGNDSPELDRWKNSTSLTVGGSPAKIAHPRVFYRSLGEQPAMPQTGYYLALDTGSYVLTGVNAALTATRYMAADVGSYVLTGVSAGVVHGYVLATAVGSYALTGIANTLSYLNSGARSLIGTVLSSLNIRGKLGS